MTFADDNQGSEQKALFAILLQGDFVGQHESGCERLFRHFEIPIKKYPLGIVDRSVGGPIAPHKLMSGEVTSVVKYLDGGAGKWKWRQKTRSGYLLAADWYGHINGTSLEGQVKKIGVQSATSEIEAAWSGDAFAIIAYSVEKIAFVKQLQAAMERGDFAMWAGRFSDNPFERHGLVLCVPSLVSSEHKRQMEQSDQDTIDLVAAAASTGIGERLHAASEARMSGLRYPKPFGTHAFEPAWSGAIQSTSRGTINTDYPVVFFLNPHDQSNNNFGWFTVEELDLWIAGEGPIPKQKDVSPATSLSY